MEPYINKAVLEDRIRAEFAIAFNALENAPTEEKPQATSRLNRAVRALYDVVAHDKIPTDLRPLTDIVAGR